MIIMGTNSKFTRFVAMIILVTFIFSWSALPILAVAAPPVEDLTLEAELSDEEQKTIIVNNETSVSENNKEEPDKSPSLPPVTDDIYLLAKLIYAEARGESFAGKVAVGAVILNRVRDPRFPNTIAGIIFKKGEFCTVRDGQINLTPDEECIRAARYASAGWDPTNGALYFYNPIKTTSKWIWSRTPLTKIGNHVFAV